MPKIGIIGCGFWVGYEVAAWQELPIEIVAVCDPNLEKAQTLADKFGIEKVYGGCWQSFCFSFSFYPNHLLSSLLLHRRQRKSRRLVGTIFRGLVSNVMVLSRVSGYWQEIILGLMFCQLSFDEC